MLQCKDCEYFVRGPSGEIGFRCDPFGTVKESECLVKWQLLRSDQLLQRVDAMVRAYQATLDMYKRLAPLQEKMFKHLEREIDDTDDADAWKRSYDEDDDNPEDRYP